MIQVFSQTRQSLNLIQHQDTDLGHLLMTIPADVQELLLPFKSLDAQLFLAFYGVLCGLAIMAALVCRTSLRKPRNLDLSEAALSDPETIAALSGGWQSVFHSALTKLVQDGSVRIEKVSIKGSLPFSEGTAFKAFANRAPSLDDSGTEQAILIGSGETGVSIVRLRQLVQFDAVGVVDSIRTQGLIESRASLQPPLTAVACLIGSTLFIGALKLLLNLYNQEMDGYLILSLLAFALVGMALMSKPYRSKSGESLLQRLKKNHDELKQLMGNETASLDPNSTSLAVALYGITSCKLRKLSLLRSAIESTFAST